MTAKRWIAVAVAATLIFVSIGINTMSWFFTRDWNNLLNEITAVEQDVQETVVEDGSMDERIAVLSVDGVIQDTGAASLFSGTEYNHQRFMAQLAQLNEDPTVKGIVLSVNSPGGGVLESSDIYDAFTEMQETKEIPIYVAMGGMAASGGYYISAPAEKIFVHPETLTGSIGVIMQSINYGKLAEKYGVDFPTIKSGPYKDMMSPTREMKPEEREMLQEMIDDSYNRFVDIIAQGRGMDEKEVRKVADGRVMNGRQAIEAGLADDYGKLPAVVSAMKEDYHLENASVFEYGAPDNLASLLSLKAHDVFGGDVESQIIKKMIAENQAPRMMYLYGE
ncbi:MULTISPECIES: signal peptide peptidase SppA [unclassified Sporosarcina]|uniref:signal peptide peptidase SppA n=2 Tax=Sporosarcina TaxID=1569 RepID=UPI00203DB459|nr:MULTISPECIES: signal peptide peptidase SppA [unclassified Sporosarcina]GKV64816.1 peptidase [Sporosarcina sp. NCCP-2331]GLB54926.1 peptidase [Sporosarcina sp. NCCP-2378]